jgi:hypothetical protein
MSDETDGINPSSAESDHPIDTSRRRFLGGVAVLGAGAALTAYGNQDNAPGETPDRPLSAEELDKALHDQVKTVVVIYAENRSFNNLFGDFPGVEKPLSALQPADYQQRDRDGSLLQTLPPVWGGVLQIGPQTLDGVTYPNAVQFQENLPNAPFALKGPNAEDLPFGLVTRDLWHVFYQNQMQINGGKNDGFVAWADSGGLTMGHYAQSQYSLRLWDIARDFVLCDNFFQGAFGGSFLNHQYLISATAPFYPDAANSVAKSQIAVLQSNDPADPRLKPLESSPASAMTGPPQFGPSALTPDGYGVNTLAIRTTPNLICRTSWFRRPTSTSATSCRRRTSIGPGTRGPGRRRWSSTRIREAFRKSRTFSTTTSRSTISNARARKTRRNVKSACAMAAWGTNPARTSSLPTPRRASCRR